MHCDKVVTCPERAKSFLPLSPLSWGGPTVQRASTVGLGQMIKAQGTWCEIEFYADRTSFNIFRWGGTFARARMALPVSGAWPPFRQKKASGGTARAPGSHIQTLQHCGVDALAGRTRHSLLILEGGKKLIHLCSHLSPSWDWGELWRGLVAEEWEERERRTHTHARMHIHSHKNELPGNNCRIGGIPVVIWLTVTFQWSPHSDLWRQAWTAHFPPHSWH